jgi:hypothetical protein
MLKIFFSIMQYVFDRATSLAGFFKFAPSLVVTAAFASLILVCGCNETSIDFNTQVKPILNKRCISCHGGVKQNGGFSVLFREEALDTTESGKFGIVPGDAHASEMIRRLTLTDPELRMPYKEEQLTKEEINILTKWIDQGAQWGRHWTYEMPDTSLLTLADNPSQNGIDYFIQEKLEDIGLQPSPEAEKETLIRRVYLDLIGIPPSEAQAMRFINDNDPKAYENVVDSLLMSPHFGEKWASWWLDLARYSDTKGYERDAARNIWRYRDWVIRSLNADKPFDVFTIEQLAGDLLPNATEDQLIATAFHRNTMNNDEGGTEDEEFRVAAVLDRVNTTWEIWQSTTMACVQCHSHPYDPIRHEDYYRTMAFFDNTRDEDTHGEYPNLRTYTRTDSIKIEEVKAWVRKVSPEREPDIEKFIKVLEPKYHPHDFDQFVNAELIDTKWLGIRPGGSARIRNIHLDKNSQLIMNYWKDNDAGEFDIHRGSLTGPVIAHVKPKKTGSLKTTVIVPLQRSEGVFDLYFVFRPDATLKKDQPVAPIEWLAFVPEFPGKGDKQHSEIQNTFITLLNAPAELTPVTIENEKKQRRVTHVFERGNRLVKGEAIQGDIPATFKTDTGKVSNRLQFAKWLVSDKNSLTARSVSNRIWEQLFGKGIIETLEDFGSQGATPTHRELLDYLAVRLTRVHDWRIKPLIRDIVTSATYRQGAHATEEMLEKDFSNEYYARAPRVRLSAEQIRDQALSVSGLLSKKLYGRSVMPYQPEGIWMSVWNGQLWTESEGDDAYRRAVYTFIKRTSPYPSMMTFDGSSREVCLSRRIRTNTPLQALNTMNDVTFVRASRSLAGKMSDVRGSLENKLNAGYKRITFRDLTPTKRNALLKLYREAEKSFKADTGAVAKLMADQNASPDLAALTVVANAMLNLDEVIMKE